MFISYIAQSNMQWYDRVRITTLRSTQPNPGEDIHHTVISINIIYTILHYIV